MDELLERLRGLDSCAVSDALDRLGLSGVALGLAQLSTTRRIVGRAVTVQLGPDDGRTSKRHLCTAAVESADAQSVIVIAHRGRVDVAGWGGILSLAASRRHVAGVVIDGACRDLDESRELELPVYGRVAVPVTARGRIIEYDWNVPVEIAGVEVAPDDLVIADGSGVVFIPMGRAAEVVQLAATIAQREQLMAADVRAGKLVSQVMGANYENMLKDVQGS
jgi:4-hydroxy-4-methyl-2-oxoglutarate aldolase